MAAAVTAAKETSGGHKMQIPDLTTVLTVLSLVLFSLVVPLGIFIGRNNIRAVRKEMVRDLERLFSFAKLPTGEPLIIPSFELVKYKYDPEANPDRSPSEDPNRIAFYLVPVLTYVILTGLGFHMAFLAHGPFAANFYIAPIDNVADRKLLGVETYTFIAGYIWTIQYLTRRISNFDLAPISFFQSSAHILLGLFTMAAIWQSHVLAVAGDYPLVAVAFLVGLFPRLGLDALFAKVPWLKLKRINKDSVQLQ
jgi:hypothetical protein